MLFLSNLKNYQDKAKINYTARKIAFYAQILGTQRI